MPDGYPSQFQPPMSYGGSVLPHGLSLLSFIIIVMSKAKASPVTDVKSEQAAVQGQSEFLIKTEWLSNYSIIDGVGKYRLQVTTDPSLYNPADFGEDGNPRYIVNVKAILRSDLPKIAELVKANPEAIKASEIQKLFLNGNVWVNEDGTLSNEVPMKGEFVEAIIDEVESREGEMVHRIVGMKVEKAKKAPKLDLASLLGTDEDSTK